MIQHALTDRTVCTHAHFVCKKKFYASPISTEPYNSRRVNRDVGSSSPCSKRSAASRPRIANKKTRTPYPKRSDRESLLSGRSQRGMHLSSVWLCLRMKGDDGGLVGHPVVWFSQLASAPSLKLASNVYLHLPADCNLRQYSGRRGKNMRSRQHVSVGLLQ